MATVKDPVCGKDVDTLRARAVGIFGGQTFYFCSQECKARYVDPRKAPRPVETKTEAKAAPLPDKKAPLPEKKAPLPEKKAPPPSAAAADELEELPPMATEAAGGELDLPDLTPAKSHRENSASVMAEIGELKRESRRWAVIIVILAALVVAAVVLSLRN